MSARDFRQFPLAIGEKEMYNILVLFLREIQTIRRKEEFL
jgi:hypothetical protein